MLTRPVLAVLASVCLGFSAQASELSPLPSLALDPPSSLSSSKPYDERQFTPYTTPSIGSAKPTSDDVGANQGNPANPLGTTKPGPGGLDYDLGDNLHMHLSIAGGAAAGGAIGH
jgi:hypothetical protein